MDTRLVYDRFVDEQGFSASHLAILDAVPFRTSVLDVGCASGYLGQELQRRKGCVVSGVEYDEGAVRAARARGIDARQIDLEHESLDVDGFDVVIFADVLEHLHDPLSVLSQARRAPLVIVSLPNIAHWSARWRHLKGAWPQEASGLFDRTHLRYFTHSTARDLVQDADLVIIEEHYTAERLPLEAKLRLARFRQSAATRWPALFAYQFVFSLRPERS